MFEYAKKKRKTDRGNAIEQKKQKPRLRADRPSNNWPQINMFFFSSSSNLSSFPKVGRYWPERLFNQKRKLKAQIWALQPKVREAYENLRISSRFCADMFLKVRHLGSVKRSKEGDGRNKILLRPLIVEMTTVMY